MKKTISKTMSKTMSRRKIVVTVCLLSLLLLISSFAGCAVNSQRSLATEAGGYGQLTMETTVGAVAGKADASWSEGVDAENGGAQEYTDDTMLVAGDIESVNTGSHNLNEILMQRKIIRNANLSIEVEDFDVAYGKIKTLISPFGFVQETNIKKEKYYIESEERLVTRGVIVVRVDRAHFDEIMSGLDGLGLIYDEIITSNDVTDQYFDIESRLRLLRYEESRLEEYLKRIDDPDIIFKTESRLTDIRHEIESLTGTLNKLGDLVELSTITLNVNEKIPGIENISVDKPYLEKLWGGFMNSLKQIGGFLGDLLVFIFAALPVLVVLALAVLIFIVILRSISRRMRGRNGTAVMSDAAVKSGGTAVKSDAAMKSSGSIQSTDAPDADTQNIDKPNHDTK